MIQTSNLRRSALCGSEDSLTFQTTYSLRNWIITLTIKMRKWWGVHKKWYIPAKTEYYDNTPLIIKKLK